eukprot:GHVU01067686.1.p1 GENE.GHVU01067686.1~~GHVU01067686.1.p1  ORF type:complete len:1407 (+),score=272.23 GHVU01067686.1:176-4222(+)
MLNEKFRQRIPAWDSILPKRQCTEKAASEPQFTGIRHLGKEMETSTEETVAVTKAATLKFKTFFYRSMKFCDDHTLSLKERQSFIMFLINAFQSLENDIVRQMCLSLCGLPMWLHIPDLQREMVLEEQSSMKRYWKKVERKYQKLEEASGVDEFAESDRDCFHRLIVDFLEIIEHGYNRSDNVADGGEGAGGAESTGGGSTKAAGDVVEFVPTEDADGEDSSKARRTARGSDDVDMETGTPEKGKGEDTNKENARLKSAVNSVSAEAEHPSGKGERKLTFSLEELAFCERALELFIDLLDQLPTRRLFRPLLLTMQVVVRCKVCTMSSDAESALFRQLVDLLSYYEQYEVDDDTGEPLDFHEIEDIHYRRMAFFQVVCFQHFKHVPALHKVALTNVSNVDSKEALKELFESLEKEQLVALSCHLRLADENRIKESIEAGRMEGGEEGAARALDELRSLLIQVLVYRLQKRSNLMAQLNKEPLFPTEEVLWNPSVIPSEKYRGEYSLALPKLNLQFLTIHDYLMRNMQLFRLESAYGLRESLQDAVARMKPRRQPEGTTKFAGSARMAVELQSFAVVVIKKPKVGQTVPSEVRAEVIVSLGRLLPHVRKEWDEIRQFDVLMLVGVVAPEGPPFEGHPSDLENVTDFPQKMGVVAVRGCEVVDVVDSENNLVSELNPGDKKAPIGEVRTYRVLLDAAQYQLDLRQSGEGGGSDVYSTLNLVVRRKPEENNFKAILETVKGLMNSPSDTVVPEWLHDMFLGYGDPSSTHYSRIDDRLSKINFLGTFLDYKHLQESFFHVKEICNNTDVANVEELKQPFVVGFEGEDMRAPTKVTLETYKRIDKGPYEENKLRTNTIRFSPVQVEAIRSGVNPGLTMIVGPPGTGKTDTAVQIVNLLLHNFPNQRIVMVTHSNEALNDLFSKIVALDVEERHLLRLGVGSRDLRVAGGRDFSKWGRVNHMLQVRLDALEKVERLSKTLNIDGEIGDTCEAALHFKLTHVDSRIERYKIALRECGKDGSGVESYLQKLRKEKGLTELVWYRELEALKKKRDARAKKRQRMLKKTQVEGSEDQIEVESDEDEKMEEVESDNKLEEEIESYTPEKMIASGKWSLVSLLFPFSEFFGDVLPSKFKGEHEADHEVAESCFKFLECLFEEVSECRAFELLRNSYDRGNYLLTKHSRVVAMTCTHAALTRKNLIDFNFKYDTLLVEEAAQILEVETFIPMLLQRSERGASRLKRVILIGDHHQLPPVVKHRAFQQYGKMDQSLFTRFVRLQSPYLQLDRQGRCRPSILDLYKWRYDNLGSLPKVEEDREFKFANGGMLYEYQFIDVPDYDGRGESTPLPYFYQNLGGYV